MSDTDVQATVRSVGTLRYLHGVERVEHYPADSLGDARLLVGLPVQGGEHGGRKIGMVIAARRHNGRLVAKLRIDSDDDRAKVAGGPWSQMSVEYLCDVVAGVQRNFKPIAVAAVGAARCGAICSVSPRKDSMTSHRRFDVDALPRDPAPDDPQRAGAGTAPAALTAKVLSISGSTVTIAVADPAMYAKGSNLSIVIQKDPEARADEARDDAARRRMIERGAQRPAPVPPVRPTRSPARAYR